MAPAAAAPRVGSRGAQASPEVQSFVNWVLASRDNQGLSFVIVDKRHAEVFVYRPTGELRGARPALLGLARGDEAPADIGHRPLADIRPDERITPAGRFVASLGQDLGEKDVLWIDYDGAFALHRVVTGNPADHRLRRLATPTTADNRISYGCINVAADFFDAVVEPSFADSAGIVYVLPEVEAIGAVFKSYRDTASLDP
jgi:hypothetical protein